MPNIAAMAAMCLLVPRCAPLDPFLKPPFGNHFGKYCPAVQLENLPVLQQLLAGYRSWEAELEAFTKDASGAPVDPSFEQLASASHAARAWPITSPLRSLADDTFHKTGVCVGFISYTSLGAAPRLLSQPQAAQAVSLPVKLLLLPP